MTCLEVRELLPEMSVGVLPARERERLGRHLQWCAGCRKEAGDLEQAAATLAFALPSASPPADLEERVVARIKRAAATPATRRRARTVAASLVAAAIAFASLGWGAVMAGRADRFANRAAQAERQKAAAIEEFRKVYANVIPGSDLPDNETHMGPLTPVAGGTGGGFVLQLVSPTMLDFVMVSVNGLNEPDRLPLRVQLVNGDGKVLRAGQITSLDADGGDVLYHQFDTQNLSGFTKVRVIDDRGQLVLAGTVDQSS
ncbi:MAG TPA: zf-HC2 domain-containing protein [Actinomycetota bacterium]|nr:zf-HC2 domain-containing protein [Actinomycetota bacterium]